MIDDALHALAQQAGLGLHWTDYKGVDHTVADDVLRAALAAMQIAADSSAIAQDSLEFLREQTRNATPTLLVTRCDQPLRLPPAIANRLQQHERVHIQREGGDWFSAGLLHAAQGELLIEPIAIVGYHTLLVGDTPVPIAVAPRHAYTPADATTRARIWGLSTQLYSLRRQLPDQTRSECGFGDFTALAQLARRAAMQGADALAISPAHALFSADVKHFSPYSPSSRLFLNILHIDIASIVNETGLREMIAGLQLGDELTRVNALPLIDWPAAARAKLTLLKKLWQQLGARWMRSDNTLALSFQVFCQRGGESLKNHARFEALHAHHLQQSSAYWNWRQWPQAFSDPASAAVEEFAQSHDDEVSFHLFLQWLASRGLAAAQRAALDSGMAIGIIADLAVGTDNGGSHVWSRQADFLMGLQVGAPPDAINTLGQDWGLTTFSPMALQQHGYQPFLEMLRANLQHVGGLRIDHILGLRRLWVLPSGAQASEGVYLNYPMEDLLNLIALESQRHRGIIIGEDLGTVPPGFSATLADNGILGMQVLWFQRDYGFFIEPSRWSAPVMATTSTHDLPTVAGWWRELDLEWQDRVGQRPQENTLQQLRQDRAGDRDALWAAFCYAEAGEGETPMPFAAQDAVDAAVRFVAQTPAVLAMIPVEDLLGLDEQPNLPGTIDQHPNWRRRLATTIDQIFEQPQVKARVVGLNEERG